jgi:hypothetical protein
MDKNRPRLKSSSVKFQNSGSKEDFLKIWLFLDYQSIHFWKEYDLKTLITNNELPFSFCVVLSIVPWYSFRCIYVCVSYTFFLYCSFYYFTISWGCSLWYFYIKCYFVVCWNCHLFWYLKGIQSNFFQSSLPICVIYFLFLKANIGCLFSIKNNKNKKHNIDPFKNLIWEVCVF